MAIRSHAIIGAILCSLAVSTAHAAPPPPPPDALGAGDGQAPGGAQPSGGTGVSGNVGSYGTYGFPPGGEYSEDTSADPNYISGPPSQPTDSVYGPQSRGEDQAGYDIVDTGYGQLEAGYGGAVPEYHVVEKGDTLWEICDIYYRDPYLWPRVWSYNEQITNAHWIFPGDRIRLTDPNDITGPSDGLDGSSLTYKQTEKRKKLENQTYVLDRWAYISDEDYEESMKIVGGGQAKVMLSVLDTAYVGYQPENPPIAGERLAVYRPVVDVYDVELKGKNKQRVKKGDRIGKVVEIVGEVYITDVAKKSAESEVVDSIRPIERGMRVGELQTRFSRIDPVPNEASDVGRIVHVTRDHDLAGEKQFVVVNMGATRGVRRGNILDVVHKGDEYNPVHNFVTPYEEGHPRRIIGRVLVVQVQKESALAVVIDGYQEFVIGDPVEMRGPEMDANDARSKNKGSGKPNASGDADFDSGDGKASGKAGFQLGN